MRSNNRSKIGSDRFVIGPSIYVCYICSVLSVRGFVHISYPFSMWNLSTHHMEDWTSGTCTLSGEVFQASNIKKYEVIYPKIELLNLLHRLHSSPGS
jgi:hypothetical protein